MNCSRTHVVAVLNAIVGSEIVYVNGKFRVRTVRDQQEGR